MIDDAFFQWLKEGLQEGSLTGNEIHLALDDRKIAYRIFLEFIESDWKESGELAQGPIRRFKDQFHL